MTITPKDSIFRRDQNGNIISLADWTASYFLPTYSIACFELTEKVWLPPLKNQTQKSATKEKQKTKH